MERQKKIPGPRLDIVSLITLEETSCDGETYLLEDQPEHRLHMRRAEID